MLLTAGIYRCNANLTLSYGVTTYVLRHTTRPDSDFCLWIDPELLLTKYRITFQ